MVLLTIISHMRSLIIHVSPRTILLAAAAIYIIKDSGDMENKWIKMKEKINKPKL